MKINIIGAGMAGLLAGNMLRHHEIKIWEAQSKLPNNHHAVLRFRSTKVSDALNIPFKKVTMVKDVAPSGEGRVADALNYSWKISGKLRTDRSILRCPEISERFIAPPDLIAQMAERVKHEILFDCSRDWLEEHFKAPIISTIPMPILVGLLDYPDKNKLEFNYRNGHVIQANIENCDAYATIYVAQRNSEIQRASITGDQLLIEIQHAPLGRDAEYILQNACRWLGIDSGTIHNVEVKEQKYAKIQPMDEDERKRFMFWATDQYGIYSLGRFATWRPGLLLDDLVQDIQLIERWITKSDRYAVKRHR